MEILTPLYLDTLRHNPTGVAMNPALSLSKYHSWIINIFSECKKSSKENTTTILATRWAQIIVLLLS